MANLEKKKRVERYKFDGTYRSLYSCKRQILGVNGVKLDEFFVLEKMPEFFKTENSRNGYIILERSWSLPHIPVFGKIIIGESFFGDSLGRYKFDARYRSF